MRWLMHIHTLSHLFIHLSVVSFSRFRLEMHDFTNDIKTSYTRKLLVELYWGVGTAKCWIYGTINNDKDTNI